MQVGHNTQPIISTNHETQRLVIGDQEPWLIEMCLDIEKWTETKVGLGLPEVWLVQNQFIPFAFYFRSVKYL